MKTREFFDSTERRNPKKNLSTFIKFSRVSVKHFPIYFAFVLVRWIPKALVIFIQVNNFMLINEIFLFNFSLSFSRFNENFSSNLQMLAFSSGPEIFSIFFTSNNERRKKSEGVRLKHYTRD